MKKIIFQFITILFLFFGSWFVLKQFDWVTIFSVKMHTQRMEEKLGDLFWDMINRSEKESDSFRTKDVVSKLLDRICEKNNIESSKIKIHILVKDEINAFALPNNHLVIYSGLIAACENEAELSGIIGHEIAHMEKKHLMKKLVNEVGLSALVSISTGNSSSGLIKNMVKLLTTSAYDRKLETEADLTAIDYLIKAEIDPEPMADFLYRLSKESNSVPEQLDWLRTHPDSEDRAKKIIEVIKNKIIIKTPVLESNDWEEMKTVLKVGL